jgi:hypothetical protein
MISTSLIHDLAVFLGATFAGVFVAGVLFGIRIAGVE